MVKPMRERIREWVCMKFGHRWYKAWGLERLSYCKRCGSITDTPN